jgi:hypothetical protein
LIVEQEEVGLAATDSAGGTSDWRIAERNGSDAEEHQNRKRAWVFKKSQL